MENIETMEKKRTRIPQTEEAKKNISEGMKKANIFRTQEQKDYLSLIKKGIPRTEEIKKKISDGWKRRKENLKNNKVTK